MQQKPSLVIVLADTNTAKFCCNELISLLKENQINIEMLVIEANENSKSLDICQQLWARLVELNTDRSSILINVGGGVVTDLGGFVASTFKRGIPFINLPTSLLAMVDAALGGKTGINFNGLKNYIGTFNLPVFTQVNSKFLESLPIRELHSGLAECLKHALIADIELWNLIEENSIKENIDQILQSAINVKLKIVAADPKEQGERKKLNFGHTIGHAVESCLMSGKKPIPHGHAVAIGVLCESSISAERGILSKSNLELIFNKLHKFYESTAFTNNEIDAIVKLTHADKKNRAGQVNCTLLTKIGEAVIDQNITDEEIRNSLNYYQSI